MERFDTTMLMVGKVPQYFFDNLLIEQLQDVTKTVHSPEKHPGPIVVKDKPYENHLYITFDGWSVFKDEATNEIKFFYEDWSIDPAEVLRQKVFYCAPAITRMAVSKDGIKWEKPEIGLPGPDGKKTNAVIGSPTFEKLESICVFTDSLATDPQKRYKMMLTHYVHAQELAEERKVMSLHEKMDGQVSDEVHDEIRLEMHSSPDGVNWTKVEGQMKFGRDGNNLGDCACIFVDEEVGIYRLITRAAGMCSAQIDERRPITDSFFGPTFPHDPGRMNKRRVYLSESRDLIHWTRPQLILAPDSEEDNIDDSYYGMIQYKLGDYYVGFLNVLHQVADTMDVRLVYSRDGVNWHQANNRQPWLTLSPGEWDQYMVNMSSVPVTMGDELYVYYGGANCRHDWWIVGQLEGLPTQEAQGIENAPYGLGVAKMRKDGYVSIDAGEMREGIMITRVLRPEGRELVLNAACGEGGYIRVEVTDGNEHILGNCSKDNCDTFTGDSTEAKITWGGKSEIDHQGPVRLRIFMKNASLYSFAFV